MGDHVPGAGLLATGAARGGDVLRDNASDGLAKGSRWALPPGPPEIFLNRK